MQIHVYVDFTMIDMSTTMLLRKPVSLDVCEIDSIDYGNYGNEYDRHFAPGLQEKDYGSKRPLIVIRTKEDGVMYATDSIKFRHIPVE